MDILKDYIVAKWEEAKDKLSKIETFMEDHKPQLEKEKNVTYSKFQSESVVEAPIC